MTDDDEDVQPLPPAHPRFTAHFTRQNYDADDYMNDELPPFGSDEGSDAVHEWAERLDELALHPTLRYMCSVTTPTNRSPSSKRPSRLTSTTLSWAWASPCCGLPARLTTRVESGCGERWSGNIVTWASTCTPRCATPLILSPAEQPHRGRRLGVPLEVTGMPVPVSPLMDPPAAVARLLHGRLRRLRSRPPPLIGLALT